MKSNKTSLRHWIGRILSGLAISFLIFDGVLKFFMDKLPPEGLEAIKKLEWPMDLMPAIGIILLLCTILYIIPRTSVIGAVLLTGYLGGAVASHVRVGNPLLSHTMFPVYIGVFVWLGLYLRDLRLRHLFSETKLDANDFH